MSFSRKNILIAEDEIIISLDIQQILINAGYPAPIIVDNSEEAIKAAEKRKPDLLLIDFLLKGNLNGYEAGEIIKNKYKIPVIYMTGLSIEETNMYTGRSRKYKIIPKPFSSQDLITAVNDTISKRLKVV